MIHETYDISQQDMRKLLELLAHPSLEEVERQEKQLRQMCKEEIVERTGSYQKVIVKGLDLSFISEMHPYVKAVPGHTKRISFSTMDIASVYAGFTLNVA